MPMAARLAPTGRISSRTARSADRRRLAHPSPTHSVAADSPARRLPECAHLVTRACWSRSRCAVCPPRQWRIPVLSYPDLSGPRVLLQDVDGYVIVLGRGLEARPDIVSGH